MLCRPYGHTQFARGELRHAPARGAVDGHSGVRGHWAYQNFGKTGQPCGQEASALAGCVQFQRADQCAKRKATHAIAGGRSVGRRPQAHQAFGRVQHSYRTRFKDSTHAHTARRLWCGHRKNTTRVTRNSVCRFTRSHARQTANRFQPLVWQHGHGAACFKRRTVYIRGQRLRQTARTKQPSCRHSSVLAHQPF